MSIVDNMYHQFFGMKPQTNEADLLNQNTKICILYSLACIDDTNRSHEKKRDADPSLLRDSA